MICQKLHHAVLLFSIAAVFLVLIAQSACGADMQMEIFYLPHPPAMAVVDEVEKVAAEFDNIVISKYSFDDPSVEKLLQKYNLTGHMPVAIFINGRNSFTVNGQKIALRNFPKGNAFVPTFKGEWDYADLRVILQQISGGK